MSGGSVTASRERWEGSPLERAGKDEHEAVDLPAGLSLVGSIEGDACTLVSFEDAGAGRFLHVSSSSGSYAINGRGPEEAYFFRTTPRDCDGHVSLWIAGFEWELHRRFVLDRSEAEAAVAELFEPGAWDFANGRWEEASVGPDSRPLSLPTG